MVAVADWWSRASRGGGAELVADSRSRSRDGRRRRLRLGAELGLIAVSEQSWAAWASSPSPSAVAEQGWWSGRRRGRRRDETR
nr:hypothetical protein Iba_chr12bCG23750 [Ipomoea batatas]